MERRTIHEKVGYTTIFTTNYTINVRLKMSHTPHPKTYAKSETTIRLNEERI
jgi:hypothetical protein